MRNLTIILSIIFLTACSIPAKKVSLSRVSELVREGEVSKTVVMNEATVDVYLTKNMAKGPHLQVEIQNMEEVIDSLNKWYDELDVDFRIEETGY